MCIRDSFKVVKDFVARVRERSIGQEVMRSLTPGQQVVKICLLYTSDAADERSSVDLGGRRIIKKKKQYRLQQMCICDDTA